MDGSFNGYDDIDGAWKYICSISPKPEIMEMQQLIGCRLIDDNQVTHLNFNCQILIITNRLFNLSASHEGLMDGGEEFKGNCLSIL